MAIELHDSIDIAEEQFYFGRDRSSIHLNLQTEDISFPLDYINPSFPPLSHLPHSASNGVHINGINDGHGPTGHTMQTNGHSYVTLPAGNGDVNSMNVDPISNGESDDEMDDAASATSSDVTEVGLDDISGSFSEHNNRLFHSHGTSMYPLPVDGDEWKRLDAEYAAIRVLLGNHVQSPINEFLAQNSTATRQKRVVDLCTGTGTWVLDMARQFEHVQFRGLDLAPIATRYPPENVRFELADVTKGLRFADSSVDVVNARHTMLGYNDYPRMLSEAARILRPGGLFLACEWGPYPALHPAHPYFVDPTSYLPYATQFYCTVRDAGLESVPVPLHIPDLIRATGLFYAPTEQRFMIPIGSPYFTPTTSLDAETQRGLRVLARVMLRSADGYAGAMSVGADARVEHALGNAYVQEMMEKEGVVGVWHIIWAKKL